MPNTASRMDRRHDWENAFDSLEASAIIFDATANRIVQFNQSAIKFLGFSGYELAQLKVSDLFGAQLPALIALTLECEDAGHAWSSDLRVHAAGGKSRAVEIAMSRFTDDDERNLYVAVLNDLKAARSRHARNFFGRVYLSESPDGERVDTVFRELTTGSQLILDAAGEGIYGVDAKGDTTFLNPAGEAMLGWSAEELIGLNAHYVFHHSHQDGTDYPIRACPIYAAFRDGRVHTVDNEVFWRKDGSSFPVEYTSTPIEDKGRLLGAVVVFRDVSERRNAERKLLDALSEVEDLKRRLEQENAYLQYELRAGINHKEIVGSSAPVRSILKQIELVASTDASVLITGESGTGKELIARAIHEGSERSRRPMIRVNCASIPRDLFESEFFGHAKGAFTGAVAERVGRFELADGGTIFLDEVGELPLEHQAKLLRILQDKQFERVGETKTRKVDIRVIAATNRNLADEVERKAFREDLFFRLNVFPIVSPPLRDRLEDIPALTTHLLKRVCERANRPLANLTMADVERLKAYHWPGNIRELENVLERAVITAADGRLRFHVPSVVREHADGLRQDFGQSHSKAADGRSDRPDDNAIPTDSELRKHERAAIEAAMWKCGGRVAGPGGAAALLGLNPSTLYSRLRRSGIDGRQFKNAT